MSPKLRQSRNIAVTATILAALASTTAIVAQPNSSGPNSDGPNSNGPNSAAAGVNDLIQAPSQAPLQEQALPSLPEVQIEQSRDAPSDVFIQEPAPVRAPTLVSLVAAQPQPADLPRELNCLAGAIYFEAKSESLSGQLAVGRVVVARSKSGRFPNSYCGVVFQPSQFSFVRGGTMPGIARGSRQWRNAVAIAQIAHGGSWRSPVEGALFFHAARVSPAWRLTRMARVENHIFYR